MQTTSSYILNTVQKSGYKGFADDEIYSMAVHYYEEENIEVGKLVNCQVVVNHQVELTPEEKFTTSEISTKYRSTGLAIMVVR